MFQHQIDSLMIQRKIAVASKLEDELLSNPPAVYAIFNSLFTEHTEYVYILSVHSAQRTQFLAEQQNRSKSMTQNTGVCIGNNFKMGGCDDSTCPYSNHCIFHNDAIQHPSMQCSENPNRWKKNEINRWNNNAPNVNHSGRQPQRRRDCG